MNYKQREIILVPFPFSDLSLIKQRPALIISLDTLNKEEDLVVVAITSQIKAGQKFRITLSNNELENGKIPKASQIRCNKIYTLSRTIVRKKIAKLNHETFQKVIFEIEKVYKNEE